MTTDALADVVRRLSASSRRSYQNPYESITWPDDLDRAQWFTSPEMISLYGTPAWHALAEDARRELSFWEAVNFFSLNIHGERVLMEGLAHRLYRPGLEPVAQYLHHFLDEENKHSVWFATFCTRYAGRIYPDRKVVFPREYADGEEDVLFFAKVSVFEEIVDRYNLAMARDERLVPVVRQINANHHAEETRHLVFGRRIVAELWSRFAPRWPVEVVEGVRDHLAAFVTATWREYYNPDVYRDAGFADPWVTAREAWDDPATRGHREEITRLALRPLVAAGVLASVDFGSRNPLTPDRPDGRG
ncbi:MAG: diiron oxygenase [Actinomycetota bacterium]|nr:diiron oxygenase [Actinomycetota bacterium]